jgi:hypothetical protein
VAIELDSHAADPARRALDVARWAAWYREHGEPDLAAELEARDD